MYNLFTNSKEINLNKYWLWHLHSWAL